MNKNNTYGICRKIMIRYKYKKFADNTGENKLKRIFAIEDNIGYANTFV